jgi:DNA polymerase-3 subunit alpha
MSKIPDLVNRAMKYNMPALALTDHGNMFGIKEFLSIVDKKNSAFNAKIKDLKILLKSGKSNEEERAKTEAELAEVSAQRFKPIVGCEAYCARRSHTFNNKHAERDQKIDQGGWHLVLLAKNHTGYKNLCKLVSASWLDGFFGKPRIDKELLEKYHEGLIVSSACLGGEIPQKLMGTRAKNVDDDENRDTDFGDGIQILEENIKEAEKSILWFKKIFGDDYYLEIQRHKTDKANADTKVYQTQQAVNKAIIELARKTDTKIIATNDVHFVEEDHGEIHDRLICLSTGKDIDDPKRMRYTKQEWLKSPDEMEAIFADIPEVLENTLEIADKVEFYDINADAVMPKFEIPADFGTIEEYKNRFSQEDLKNDFKENFEDLLEKKGLEHLYRVKLEADYLEKLTMEGAKLRYGENIPEDVSERIAFELNVMKTMGFPGYFLIVEDFINAGRKMGIKFGPGRGSAAGSVVAYCLKITDLDPLKYDLLFERFLNPDRISMPDIDVDIEADGRGKVLQYVIDKYGTNQVARIITYGTMAAKSSIKDLARVQKLDLRESNRLAGLVPRSFDENDKSIPKDAKGDMPKVNLENCYKYISDFRRELNSGNSNIITILEYAKALEGTVRQTGVHACGVVIAPDDLSNYVPLSTADDRQTKEKVAVTQYEGKIIEDVGLIKMDFLGLETLDIIREALNNIKKSRGIDLDIDTIPLDDAETYQIFARGETTGIFQFESPGMKKYLRELQPTQIDDLIAMNALYRPGPMKYIPQFINRKHKRESIKYDIPIMEKRLKDTYGITVYQEQVMLLSRDLAGFTRGQSDELRKAMGKKLVEKMVALKEKFIAGGLKNGHNQTVLEKIWSDWAEFAKYAFNKSHAACYSVLAYQTGYLKAHFPSEFMAAVLTRSLRDINSVSNLMEECKAMNIKVLLPDVNESEILFTVNKKGEIRFGLGGVKNVGESAAESIISERVENGAYKDIFDFLERVNLRACNKKTIESLVYSGAFDSLKTMEREDFFATEDTIDSLIMYGKKSQEATEDMANSLFGDAEDMAIPHPKIAKVPKWNDLMRLNFERDLIGTYVSAHPLDRFRSAILYGCTHSLTDLSNAVSDMKTRFEEITDMLEIDRFIKNEHIKFVVGGIISDTKITTSAKGNPYAVFKLADYSGLMEFRLIDGWNFAADDKYYTKYGRLLEKDLFIVIRGVIKPSIQKDKLDPTQKIKRVNTDVQGVGKLDEVGDKLLKNLEIFLKLNKLDSDFSKNISEMITKNSGAVSVSFNIKDSENHSVRLQKYDGGVFISAELLTELEDMAKDETIEFAINGKKFQTKKAEIEEEEIFAEEMID